MKTKLYTIKMLTIVAFLLTAYNLNAQCDFDPTITGNALLCSESDAITLSTQTYDSYQWYRREWYWDPSVPNPNPWFAVAGATNQSITVNTGGVDFLFEFKVAATLGGCSEDSPVALIDGFAYGLPVMISTFQPGTYEQQLDVDGNFIGMNICNGASVLFENPLTVYSYHTWYRCVPSALPPVTSDPCIISGVNGLSYTATTTGNYGFYACTGYCPNNCEFLGDGSFMPLTFGDFSFCSLGIHDPQNNQLNINVYPNPTTQFINIGKIPNIDKGDFSIVDTNGRKIKEVNNFTLQTPIDVNDLASGTYLLVLKADNKIYRNKFIKK
jgi:Secretion system C-terminal sorting domain